MTFCRMKIVYLVALLSIACLLFCCFFGFLFGFFRRTREYFTTIAGEGLQIMTFAQHSWPLSSEGS